MAVKLKDLLPLAKYCAVIVEDEEGYTICWDYSRIDSRFDSEKERKQEIKECEEILAPYMDYEVKSIMGTYDGQWITLKGKKVDEDGD